MNVFLWLFFSAVFLCALLFTSHFLVNIQRKLRDRTQDLCIHTHNTQYSNLFCCCSSSIFYLLLLSLDGSKSIFLWFWRNFCTNVCVHTIRCMAVVPWFDAEVKFHIYICLNGRYHTARKMPSHLHAHKVHIHAVPQAFPKKNTYICEKGKNNLAWVLISFQLVFCSFLFLYLPFPSSIFFLFRAVSASSASVCEWDFVKYKNTSTHTLALFLSNCVLALCNFRRDCIQLR